MSATPDATARNPVKEVRQALGLSQQQMANKLGCRQKTVSKWESNSTLPTREDSLVKFRWLAEKARIKIEQ